MDEFASSIIIYLERNVEPKTGFSGGFTKLVFTRMVSWTVMTKEFKGFRIEDILANWEASILVGKRRDREVRWKMPEKKWLKFNIDQVTQGITVSYLMLLDQE